MNSIFKINQEIDNVNVANQWKVLVKIKNKANFNDQHPSRNQNM